MSLFLNYSSITIFIVTLIHHLMSAAHSIIFSADHSFHLLLLIFHSEFNVQFSSLKCLCLSLPLLKKLRWKNSLRLNFCPEQRLNVVWLILNHGQFLQIRTKDIGNHPQIWCDLYLNSIYFPSKWPPLLLSFGYAADLTWFLHQILPFWSLIHVFMIRLYYFSILNHW